MQTGMAARQHQLTTNKRASVAPGRKSGRARPDRPRDFQRSRLYRWEAVHVLPQAPGLLPLHTCHALVAEVFALRLGPDAVPPRVEDGRGRRHAAGSREVIKLPRWARTRAIVLHECAHGLSTDGHGPDFVRAYVELLVDLQGFDRSFLEESLALAGLKVTPAGQPIALPAAPRPVPATIAPSFVKRLQAIGIRTLTELRALGPVQVWVRLKQRFGPAVSENSLVALAALVAGKSAAALDGRTRAQLKFEAAGRLAAARREERDRCDPAKRPAPPK